MKSDPGRRPFTGVVVSMLGEPTDRDWPEDWKTENGRYTCKCNSCQQVFIGYKRRVRCRKCTFSSDSLQEPVA